MWESTEWDFQAYGRPLTLVSLFNYIGQLLNSLDDDWPVVVENLSKARIN